MKIPAGFRSLTLDASSRVWHRLWSVRLALASAAVSLLPALESVLPLWRSALGPVPYAALATVLAVASALARVVHQPAAQRTLDTDKRGLA